MVRIKRGPEGLAGNGGRLGHRFLEAGNGAALFARKNGGIKAWLLHDGTQGFDGRHQLVAGRQGADRNAGAVGVCAAAEVGANVGKLFGDGGFITFACAEIECGTSQSGKAGFAGGIENGAGSKVDLDVEHWQHPAFDEIDLGAGRRYPVFNLDASQRALGQKQGKCYGQQLFHGDFSSWRVAGAERRGLPSSACGSRTPMVRVSSLKYFLATDCTSAAVTFCSFSSMRSIF